jgi:hypothetical protein
MTGTCHFGENLSLLTLVAVLPGLAVVICMALPNVLKSHDLILASAPSIAEALNTLA